MAVKIITFGPIKQLTGNKDIFLDGVADTNSLVQQLQILYPDLAGAAYILAVDKEIISVNTLLSGNNTVALLPPYSGG